MKRLCWRWFARAFRRSVVWGGCVPPRPSRGAVFEPGRRPVATDCTHGAQWQLVSDSWSRTGGQLHGHQPRRPVRLSCLDEHAGAWTCAVSSGACTQERSEMERALHRRRHEHFAHQDGEPAHVSIYSTTCRTTHPYDRLNSIAGTKGIFKDYPPRIYFDGQKGGEEYGSIEAYKAQYEHPLWKKQGEIARKLGGHGGMDFIMCYRLVDCMRRGLPPDIDVYDAATCSAPAPLSEASVAQGSAPMKFPDFTRGRWKERTGSPIAAIES